MFHAIKTFYNAEFKLKSSSQNYILNIIFQLIFYTYHTCSKKYELQFVQFVVKSK